jgi:hypothetical protein
LHQGGVGVLFDFARREFEYLPQGHFLSKCHLCFDIRRHLALTVAGLASRDLQPVGCYANQ